jgi:hypothetical protein
MMAGVDNNQLVRWKQDGIRVGAREEESLQEMALLQMKYFVRSFGKTAC